LSELGTACRLEGRRDTRARRFGAVGVGSPDWHRRDGTESVRTLKGRQSPWKDRVTGGWQRQLVTTDSSAEQRLVVGCFARFRRTQTSAATSVGAGAAQRGHRGFGSGRESSAFGQPTGAVSGVTRGGKSAFTRGSITYGDLDASATSSQGDATSPPGELWPSE
jgi:hypothetical protein